MSFGFMCGNRKDLVFAAVAKMQHINFPNDGVFPKAAFSGIPIHGGNS
jgi:hypothetical protein